MEELNTSVLRVTHGERFITLFLAKYDSATRTLHYINAGHTPPFLVMNGEITRLRNGCTILGCFPELPYIEIGGVCLTGEAVIFSYTDGLTDARNKSEDDFGEERLHDFLIKNAALSPKDINKELLVTIEAFRERQIYPDDITVLTFKIAE